MLNINLEARFRNKAFIVSLISAIVLLLQQIGLKQYIPNNWNDILNTVLTILMLIGVVVDTSTPGISDQVANNLSAESANTTEEVKTEDSTTAINSTVTPNITSSKVQVDNPDNVQAIGQEVNAIGATSPSAN